MFRSFFVQIPSFTIIVQDAGLNNQKRQFSRLDTLNVVGNITILSGVLTEEGMPTSVDFVRCEPNQMVAAYTTSNTYIYDIETANQIIQLDSNQPSGKKIKTANHII